jgi:4-hydroxybenzoate polyprenyltransferase
VRTFATSFGEKSAARVALIWFVLSGFLGVTLFAATSLSYVFLISFVLLFLYTGRYFLRLWQMTDIHSIKAFCPIVGRKVLITFYSLLI